MPSHIDGLNKRFGIPGIAQVVAGNGGLPFVRIQSPVAKAEISVYGAHVLHWEPADAEEVLFVSEESPWEPGKAIRGGIPVCFPWFAERADDPDVPKHGFARTREWRLDSMAALDDGSVSLVCVLEHDAATRVLFPHTFCVAYRMTVGRKLRLEFTVFNTGSTPMLFEEALHTYFRVGDAERTRVHGLGGLSYLDKTDSYRKKQQNGEVLFGNPVDRIYLSATESVDVLDHELRRRIATEKQNSQNTVVWNPAADGAAAISDLGDDEWHQMVCVEAANVGAATVTLGPGEEHTMRVTLSVTPA